MFTGLIEDVGRIAAVERRGEGIFARIRPAKIEARSLAHGESVAVDGCCLTVVEISGEAFGVEISPESLARTTLGGLEEGARVNLERALALGERLGGHMVLGHVDAVGSIESRTRRGDFVEVWFRVPALVERWLVEKGSVAVDGISLTVNRLEEGRFSVMLIPETLASTTLGEKAEGAAVNLEGDVIGKYVERLAGPYAKEQGR
jgi:riboflavin synthase